MVYRLVSHCFVILVFLKGVVLKKYMQFRPKQTRLCRANTTRAHGSLDSVSLTWSFSRSLPELRGERGKTETRAPKCTGMSLLRRNTHTLAPPQPHKPPPLPATGSGDGLSGPSNDPVVFLCPRERSSRPQRVLGVLQNTNCFPLPHLFKSDRRMSSGPPHLLPEACFDASSSRQSPRT